MLQKRFEKKLKKLLTNEFRRDSIIKLTRESGTTKERTLITEQCKTLKIHRELFKEQLRDKRP